MIDSIRLFARLGPGLLFAGAAIGTSHLVQSTRAGALYGLGLMIVVVAAYLLKYPVYRFGPAYTAATGMSLIEGYRRLGRPAVVLISISQYLVQVIILAAVSSTPLDSRPPPWGSRSRLRRSLSPCLCWHSSSA